jgi:hypothetical protein
MPITRRGFVASLIAFAGAAASPGRAVARQATRQVIVELSGPIFTADMAAEADEEWLQACVFTSNWQIDFEGNDGYPLIRHPMTGLTYIVGFDTSGNLVVRQIDARCCKCDEELDPDYIVGHAARHVAEAAFETYTSWQSRHESTVYLRFSWNGKDDAPWPAVLEPTSEDAPEIELIAAADGDASVRDCEGPIHEHHAPRRYGRPCGDRGRCGPDPGVTGVAGGTHWPRRALPVFHSALGRTGLGGSIHLAGIVAVPVRLPLAFRRPNLRHPANQLRRKRPDVYGPQPATAGGEGVYRRF